jgi:hypothetical protein
MHGRPHGGASSVQQQPIDSNSRSPTGERVRLLVQPRSCKSAHFIVLRLVPLRCSVLRCIVDYM